MNEHPDTVLGTAMGPGAALGGTSDFRILEASLLRSRPYNMENKPEWSRTSGSQK